MERGVGMVEHGSAEQQQKRWIKSLCWMFASIGVFLVVLIFLGIIVWLIIRPKSPDMTLQAVRVDDLKVHYIACFQPKHLSLTLGFLISMESFTQNPSESMTSR
jgi:hypothetical protein